MTDEYNENGLKLQKYDIKPTAHEQALEEQRKQPAGFDRWLEEHPIPDMPERGGDWEAYVRSMANWLVEYRMRHL